MRPHTTEISLERYESIPTKQQAETEAQPAPTDVYIATPKHEQITPCFHAFGP